MSARSEFAARPANFQHSLLRVRRRLVGVRLAESAGIGALAGSLVAVILLCLLYWHGSPDLLLPVITSIALGATGGLAHGWNHRPTLLDAALEADRQLNLAELLSTALLLRGGADVAWHQFIVGLADAQSAAIGPRTLLLHRYGRRTWGAISLVATLALALAFLMASTTLMRAEDTITQARRAEEHTGEPADHPLLLLSADPSLRQPGAPAEAEDVGESNPDGNGRQPEANSTEHEAPHQPDRGNPSEANAPRSDRGSAGSHSAKTRVDQTVTPKLLENTERINGVAAPASSALHSASGGGSQLPQSEISRTREETPDGSIPARAGKSPPPLLIPPWQTDQWPSDRVTAQHALELGHIVPSYQDIVRDYFQPSP